MAQPATPFRTRIRTRRRSERGAVLILVAMSLAFIMTATAFSVDHGRITTNRRNLQKIADLAALDGVGVMDGRTTSEVRPDVEAVLGASFVRNEFLDTLPVFAGGATGGDSNKAATYEMGVYDVGDRTFTTAEETDVPNAVRVMVSDDIRYFFQPGDSRSAKWATAVMLLPGQEVPTTTTTTTTDPNTTTTTTDPSTTTTTCPVGDPTCEPECPPDDPSCCPEGDPTCEPECPPGDPTCDLTCVDSAALETFSLGSFLAGFDVNTPDTIENQRLNSIKALTMNAIWGRAFGRTSDAPAQPATPNGLTLPDGQLGIDVVGYQGLARTAVTLDELRAVMGFASVTELLDANIATADFFQGIIDALNLPAAPAIPATGDSRIDNRLAAIAARAPEGYDTSVFDDPSVTAVDPEADGPTTAAAIEALGIAKSKTIPQKSINLRNIVQIDEGYDNSAARSEFTVMDLVGSAALINGGNVFATDVVLPVSSPNTPLTLPSILSNRITQLQNAYGGDPDLLGTYTALTGIWPANTELVTGRLTAAVLDPPDGPKVGPAGRWSDGSYCTVAETAQLTAGLTLKLLNVNVSEAFNLLGITNLLNVNGGLADVQVPMILSGGSARAGLKTLDCFDQAGGLPSTFDVVTSAARANFGQTATLSAATPTITPAEFVTLRTATGNIPIRGTSTVNIAGTTDPDFLVTAAYNEFNTYRTSAAPAGDIGTSLFANIIADGPNIVITDLLGQDRTISRLDLTRSVMRSIERRVPLDSQILRPVTSALGVGLGGADLTASDVECGIRILVDDV